VGHYRSRRGGGGGLEMSGAFCSGKKKGALKGEPEGKKKVKKGGGRGCAEYERKPPSFRVRKAGTRTEKGGKVEDGSRKKKSSRGSLKKGASSKIGPEGRDAKENRRIKKKRWGRGGYVRSVPRFWGPPERYENFGKRKRGVMPSIFGYVVGTSLPRGGP